MSTVNEKNNNKDPYTGLLKTGEFARLARINRDTLAFYIRKNLITPYYVGKNKYKYFLPEQVQTIRLIKYMRACRMPLDSIRKILDDPSAENLHEQIVRQKDYLEEQIRLMKEASAFISGYISEKDYLDAHPAESPFIEHCRAMQVFSFPVRFCQFLNDHEELRKAAGFLNEQNRHLSCLPAVCLLPVNEAHCEAFCRRVQQTGYPVRDADTAGDSCEMTIPEGTYGVIIGKSCMEKLDENIARLKEKTESAGYLPDGPHLYLFTENDLQKLPAAKGRRYLLRMKLIKKKDGNDVSNAIE